MPEILAWRANLRGGLTGPQQAPSGPLCWVACVGASHVLAAHGMTGRKEREQGLPEGGWEVSAGEMAAGVQRHGR